MATGRESKPDARPAVAFAVIALVDVVHVGAQAATASDRVRLRAQLFAAGLALALGAIGSALSSLVAAAPRGRPLVALLLSWALGVAALWGDVAPRASKLPLLGAAAWSLLLSASLSSIAPASAFAFAAARERLEGSLARAGLIAAALSLAAALQVASHRLLVGNYPGVHLLCAVTAGLSLASALPRPGPRASAMALALSGLPGALALSLKVPRGVASELTRHAGVSLAPFVIEARARLSRRRAPEAAAEARPDRPPSGALGLEAPVALFVTVDCLRADIVDTHGSQLPNLAALRATSLELSEARTMAPATEVSMASMMKSRFYSSQRWRPRPGDDAASALPLDDPHPSFVSLLGKAGVRTALVASANWMRPSYALLAGHDELIDVPRQGPHSFADDVATAIVERLGRQGEGPLFLQAHFLDAHSPYDLAGTEGDDRARYVREVALVDRALGRVLAALERPALKGRAVLLLSADHGEAFYEHGYVFHATMLYDEVLRVPLWLRAPSSAARRDDALVSLADVGPTLLDLFGVVTPGSFEGLSLLPLLRGGALPRRTVAADAGRRLQAMVFPDGNKVIYDLRRDTAELYDLRVDRGETRNLYEEDPAETPHLDELRRFFDGRTLREGGYVPPVRLP